MPFTPTPYIFEHTGAGATVPLFLEGEYQSDGTVKALTLSVVPEQVSVSVPLAPTITSSVMNSRTSATINWIAPNNTGRPPITGYKIYRQNDGGTATLVTTVAGTVLTYTNSPLSTNTPEIVFGYTVVAVNADGDGAASNKVLLQWAGTPVQPPLAPTSLSFTGVSSTGATLNWAQVTDATVTKNAIYRNGVLFRDNLPASAVSNVLTGLTSGTAYSNMTVRRFNAQGWSPDSNPVSFTTGTGTGITQDPVMGQSIPGEENPFRSQLDAVRIYNFGDAVAQFNAFNPRVIAISDDGISPTSTSFVTQAQAMLETFYYGSGSAARQNCEIHIANGNEIDRTYQSGTLPAAYISVYQDLYAMVHTMTGGVRRYPKASVWVDLTARNTRDNGSGPRFKPIARYLDGLAASFYPAGRTIGPSNDIEYDPGGYPAGSIWAGNSRNAYSYFIDPILDALSDWRATGSASGGSLAGQLDSIAAWEIGIPIHHSLSGMNIPSAVKTGSLASGGSDVTQRRAYLTGGARTSGVASQQYNFKGLLQYVYDECVMRNYAMREMIYWNQQSQADIPNKWEYDAGLTTPDSVNAWNDWTPGTRMPNV